MPQKNLYQQISNAINSFKLNQPFSVRAINKSLNDLLINSPSFLSKHCVGNPGNYSEMFKRVEKGLYKLNK